MIQTFFTVFISVFLAEIGDKTQLATMVFATDQDRNSWVVFAASACALITAAAIAVVVGSQLERWISAETLKLIAGLGFVVIGIWTILSR